MNDTPQVSRLVRTAIFVSDLERSVRFYREALGYREVYASGVLEHKAGHALIGVPEDSVIRYEIVKADEINFGMVGLFEVKPSPPPVRRENQGANLGEGCMVFFATDIRAVRDRIVEFGGEIVCEPQLLVVHTLRQLEMTCRDPDGMMINIIDRPAENWNANVARSR
ncbi:MAG: VOC family protein [Gammaproteobacteria bacterium]|nr:VOC family protein [Gammaproteobacteria bacterium]